MAALLIVDRDLGDLEHSGSAFPYETLVERKHASRIKSQHPPSGNTGLMEQGTSGGSRVTQSWLHVSMGLGAQNVGERYTSRIYMCSRWYDLQQENQDFNVDDVDFASMGHSSGNYNKLITHLIRMRTHTYYVIYN